MKLPEQSSLLDQPGLHIHQPSSMHSPFPLQIFSLEHMYSKNEEMVKVTNAKNFQSSFYQIVDMHKGVKTFYSNLLEQSFGLSSASNPGLHLQ